MRRAKSLRIGVHHANAVVCEPVYRTHLMPGNHREFPPRVPRTIRSRTRAPGSSACCAVAGRPRSLGCNPRMQRRKRRRVAGSTPRRRRSTRAPRTSARSAAARGGSTASPCRPTTRRGSSRVGLGSTTPRTPRACALRTIAADSRAARTRRPRPSRCRPRTRRRGRSRSLRSSSSRRDRPRSRTAPPRASLARGRRPGRTAARFR
eukprot:30928-Pelagococcus_subviridis.AAC.4